MRIGTAFFAFDRIVVHGTIVSAKNKIADTI
jgi:hypothetical protein